MNKSLNIALSIVLVCLIGFPATSQTTTSRSYKYGKVDPEEFDTQIKGQDSAAAAIKLFDVGKGYFEISHGSGNFIYVFERHVRYKVVNKNSYDLANLEIELYRNDNGSEENLELIKGATYNLVDHKIEISKMGSDAKFSSRLDKNHIVKKFTLPNIKEGSIIEYSYRTKSDFIFKLDDWYFQGIYPCKYSAYTLILPEYYRYKIAVGGYLDIQHPKPLDIMENYVIPATNSSPSKTITSSASKNQYFAEDIPAIKNESYITTLEDYVSKVGFELTSTNFPGSSYKDYSSSWPMIVADMKKEEKFGEFIKRDNYEKGFLDGILKGEKDPGLKMNLIFNYIKNSIKWDGKYNDFSVATNQRAIVEKKSGNSAEINLCLLGLLKLAGLDACPILTSTRKNGAHPGYPLEAKFNNVIVEVEIGDKKHLLDAIDKNNVIDLISYQNLSHRGLKLNLETNAAEWIPLEYTNLSRENITYNLKLSTDNKLTGTIYRSSSNYDGLDQRKSYQEAANEAAFIKDYKSNKAGMEINSYKITNLDLPDLPLEETMDITIDDNVEDAGSLIYFIPLFFDRKKENPFSLAERNFPVDFAYPFEENVRTIIEFPANYKLDKLPKNEAFKLPGQDGSFSITYITEGNVIAIKSKINITKPVFTAEEYFTLKELFKNIVRKHAEQIVFKKS